MYSQAINLYSNEFLKFLFDKKINLNAILKELLTLVNKIHADNIMQKYFLSLIISNEKKIKLIESLTSNEDIITLSKILSKRSRLSYFIQILEKVIKLIREKKNIREAVITSVIELDDEQTEKLRKLIHKVFNYDCEIRVRLSKDIIGGLKIEINDKLLDLSLQNQFNVMRNKIQRKSIL